ncbi:MAG: exodeoxyribonuclease VII small subunit [Acidimicrobiales bacterium]|jgi:exodeoxyribonuclease VII small subunit
MAELRGDAPTPSGNDHRDELGESLTYAAAVAELEAILSELEGDDVDVDRLADQVRRAAALVRFCRSRILEARVEIEQILEGPSE